jgi:hypothetical protein
LSAVRNIWLFAWLVIYGSSRCGVSVPGLRFVDTASGVLGIEWIDGKSVRFLLGSGDEGDEVIDDDNGDQVLTPLAEFEVSKGLTSYSYRRFFLF